MRRFNQDYEEGMVVYKNGTVQEFIGDATEVTLGGDRTNAITTHNHPPSRNGLATNTIFSMKDYNSFTNNLEKEMRMVTYDESKKRNVVISIKRTRNATYTDIDLFKDSMNRLYKDFDKKNATSGWKKTAVNKNIRDLHKQTKEIANKYGFVYKQTYL